MKCLKVLLVEDNIDHCFLAKTAFYDFDQEFDLNTASSGAEALYILDDKSFDILFIDHHLPDTDGLTLMKDILDIHPDTPIVITTGRGSEELAVTTFREGAVDYIIKNENYFKLLPVVAIRIYKSRARLNGKTRPAFSARNLYDQILSTSADLLDVYISSLMLYNVNNGLLETKAHRGLSHNYLNQVRPKFGQSIEERAMAENKSVLSSNISDEFHDSFNEMASIEGIRSAMSVPFTVDGSTRGVISFYSHNEEHFQPEDELAASHLIKLSSLALQNLQLYRREHRIAKTLQLSHFPDIDSHFENWEIAHRYRVSMEEALIGGDFYDMFSVPGNRKAIVVADVSGKGISAAASTAMVKHTLRSYALDDPDPGVVLTRTHEAFCSYMGSDHFVTIFYGLIDPSNESLSYCSAGHPPALFFSAQQGKVFNLTDVFMPVGAWHDNVAYRASTLSFDPGDALLVYTDGLTDCRETGIKDGTLFGQQNLESLFSKLVTKRAETIAAGIITEVESFCHGKMNDDVAYFVLKLRK